MTQYVSLCCKKIALKKNNQNININSNINWHFRLILWYLLDNTVRYGPKNIWKIFRPKKKGIKVKDPKKFLFEFYF